MTFRVLFNLILFYLWSSVHAGLFAVHAGPAAVQLFLAPAAEAATHVLEKSRAEALGRERLLAGVAHLPVLGPRHGRSSFSATRNAEAAFLGVRVSEDYLRRPPAADLLATSATKEFSPEGFTTSWRGTRRIAIHLGDCLDLEVEFQLKNFLLENILQPTSTIFSGSFLQQFIFLMNFCIFVNFASSTSLDDPHEEKHPQSFA